MPKKEDVILQALRDITVKMDRHYEVTDTRLSAIEKVQVKQEENLGEHMRRTELLEKGQNGLSQYLRDLEKDDIQPIKRHVAIVEGVLKGLGIVAAVVSFAAAIIKIISFFHH